MPANIPLPSETADPIVLTDWLELLALSVDDGNASHGDLQRALNRLGVDGFDTICTACMRELHRRVAASKDNYPFSFTGTLLARNGDWRQYVPYVFCLLLSYCNDRMKRVKGTNHTLMFEQLACLAARGYLGGEVLRFGSPRKELPAGFHDAIRHVCGAVKEWTPVAGKTLKRKDGGLDLVAWKPFPDEQIGKLILFGHCASGADWDAKINELQPNAFCTLWLSGDRSPIVKTFFIPHRLPPELFADRAVSAGLFFDRCRIARCAQNTDFVQATKNASIAWCETVLPRLAS